MDYYSTKSFKKCRCIEMECRRKQDGLFEEYRSFQESWDYYSYYRYESLNYGKGIRRERKHSFRRADYLPFEKYREIYYKYKDNEINLNDISINTHALSFESMRTHDIVSAELYWGEKSMSMGL